jgi:RND family efflux transporter MFP subunit
MKYPPLIMKFGISFCKRRWPLLLVVGLFAWLWLSWVFSNPPTLVSALKVVPQEAVTEVQLVGHVSARHTVLASPKGTGHITEVRVREGDYVTQGQVLAVLETTPDRLGTQRAAQDQLAVAQAHLQDVEEDALANKALRMQSATATIAVAQQALATAQASHVQEIVHCPISGVVTQPPQPIGDIAIPGQALVSVAPTEALEIVAPLPSATMTQAIKLKQPAHIRLETYPGQVFEGRVTRLDQSDPPQWVAVQLDPSASPRVSVGLSSHVSVEVNRRHQALVVPLSSLVSTQLPLVTPSNATPLGPLATQQASLYTLERDRAVLQTIQYQALSGQHAVVLSGLHSGDWVVLDASKPLPDQTRLQPLRPFSAPSASMASTPAL